jgi:peptidoglycan/LPS O-acetylase OafA/YrhL
MSTPPRRALVYRPEIDGLRAIAVLPVIFFHAGFDFFSGGFVGVDIFFVISGYLITSILLRDLEEGQFSIVRFYERRVKRILPALFFVILCCLPIAWFLMLPDELQSFGQSLMAVSTFTSNIYFWRTTNYFKPSAEYLPLIHTWSLGVEEQFYVFFPLVLSLFWRIGKRNLGLLLGAAVVASFLLSEWGWRHAPLGNFFNLPTRAWELLAGSLLCFYPTSVASLSGRPQVKGVLASAGLILIVYSVFFLNHDTPFPSVYALYPVLGAMLIIGFSGRDNFAGKLLASRPLVGVGLVSYSAYLWHQPLVAFARLRMGLTLLTALLACFLSIVLAYVSWRFVETPFRLKTFKFNGKPFNLLKIAPIGLLACGLVGCAFYYEQGFPSRIDNEKMAFLELNHDGLDAWNFYDLRTVYRPECNFLDVMYVHQTGVSRIRDSIDEKNCYIMSSKPMVFLWGDSHIQSLYHGLSKTLNQVDLNIISTSGCVPSLNSTKKGGCASSNDLALRKMREKTPDLVVLGVQDGMSIEKSADLVQGLRKLGVHRFLLMGPPPHWKNSLPKRIVNFYWQERTVIDYLPIENLDADYFENDRREKEKVRVRGEAAPGQRIEYFSLIDTLCVDRGCLANLDSTHQQLLLTSFDYGHLTPAGSIYVAKNGLAQQIEQILHK